AGVEAVVRRALMKDRNERYATAGALLADFERACTGAPLDATIAHSDTTASAPKPPVAQTIAAPPPAAPAITTLRSVASEIAPRAPSPRKLAPLALGAAVLLLGFGIAGVAPRFRAGKKAAVGPEPTVAVQAPPAAPSGVALELAITPEQATVELDGVETTERALRVAKAS